MFSNLSTKDLAIVACILDEEEENSESQKKKTAQGLLGSSFKYAAKKRWGFFTLFKQLLDYETNFFQYFRMTKENFQIY
jgi:hypothetical protein